MLENKNGKHFTALFWVGVTKPVQYGADLKANTMQLLQFQKIPYDKIKEYFANQLGIPFSDGSIFSINKGAYRQLYYTFNCLIPSLRQFIKSVKLSWQLFHTSSLGRSPEKESPGRLSGFNGFSRINVAR